MQTDTQGTYVKSVLGCENKTLMWKNMVKKTAKIVFKLLPGVQCVGYKQEYIKQNRSHVHECFIDCMSYI